MLLYFNNSECYVGHTEDFGKTRLESDRTMFRTAYFLYNDRVYCALVAGRSFSRLKSSSHNLPAILLSNR